MKTIPLHEFRFFLSSSSIDLEKGVIRDVTIGKAGVQAQGHKVMFDGNGDRTLDPAQAKRKLQIATDEETLSTLMGAAQDAGGQVKCREDHDDSIGSRAGFIDNFRTLGDRSIGDLHLFDSYRNRAVVLETAAKTPGEIGLSIDFTPRFEIKGDIAFMRVSELEAVDIVDAGAITPGGLFCRKGVDNENKVIIPNLTMGDKKENDPTIADCMSLLKSLSDSFAKFSAPPADADEKKKLATAVDAMTSELAAIKTNFEKLRTETTAETLKLKQQNDALGVKLGAGAASGAAGGGGGDAAAEQERIRLAAEKLELEAKNKPKGYLELVEEAKTGALKLSGSNAHRHVMKTAPKVYEAYLIGKGVAAKVA
jgi:hypothetical protein